MSALQQGDVLLLMIEIKFMDCVSTWIFFVSSPLAYGCNI